jgi:hypothetical protein
MYEESEESVAAEDILSPAVLIFYVIHKYIYTYSNNSAAGRDVPADERRFTASEPALISKACPVRVVDKR